jgi:hypothetical protein
MSPVLICLVLGVIYTALVYGSARASGWDRLRRRYPRQGTCREWGLAALIFTGSLAAMGGIQLALVGMCADGLFVRPLLVAWPAFRCVQIPWSALQYQRSEETIRLGSVDVWAVEGVTGMDIPAIEMRFTAFVGRKIRKYVEQERLQAARGGDEKRA